MDLQIIIAILLAMARLSSSTCGYDNCHKTKPGMINVHLVPHTHDDVGWLKTVDEYFYGSKKYITPVGVQYILDSVVPELLKDPTKRFIYVEMAFFYRWWREQNDQMRHQVKNLIQNGQLEFILGGWCMNDEAAAHYNAIIDQMTWGLKFINDTFGECARPKVAWQIDPFGHAKEQASLFAQMGFDGLFFGRLDYEDKETRKASKTMELVWKGSDVLGNKSWLLTGALFNGYSPPNGFCFDVYCEDEPIMDDPRLYNYNVDRRVQEFINAVEEQAKCYTTNNIIMTMGNDFNYVNANTWYKNLDKLIKHTNARQQKGSKVNLIYSTPSCYLKSVHDSKKTYTVKRDDFFPYASDPHAYWTGYFTSRPALKGMVRKGNNFLQVCKQMGALTSRDWTPGPEGDVTVMREAMGVLQHHDAITGTAKQAVTFDYAERLAHGFSECEKVIDYAYRYFAAKDTKDLEHQQKFCQMLNITECSISETEDNFVVNIYNPLVRNVSKFVRLPIREPGYIVYDPQGASLQTQIVPIPEVILLIPGRKSSAAFELVFNAIDIPALGFKSFFVSKKKSPLSNEKMSRLVQFNHKRTIGNSKFRVGLNKLGHIDKVVKNGKVFEFKQEFGYYEGHPGNNTEFINRASGAYIFRPLNQNPIIVNSNVKPLVVKGPLVKEIHQEFSPFIHQVARIYQDSQDLEFEWLVGPIPVSDGLGKEVIVRYKSEFDSNGVFFTDSNGRQMMKRLRNKRPTWNLNVTEPVSCNYYPVNSRMYIKEPSDGSQMTVLTDRSQGGTSMQDGMAELMIHRRLLFDDAFGVGEALNEVAFGHGLVVRGKHWIQFSHGKADNPNRKHRFKAQEAFMDTIVSFTPTNLSFDKFKAKYLMIHSALGNIKLPKNVHLLTLEEWHGNSRDSVLIRFEHIFDANEDPEYSKPVTFQMDTMFANFKFSYVEEVILSANLQADKLHRLEWNVEEDNEVPVYQNNENVQPVSEENGHEITLKPMQIRSFICNIEPK